MLFALKCPTTGLFLARDDYEAPLVFVPDAGQARKFSTMADLRLFAESRTLGHLLEHEVSEAEMDRLEAKAQDAWNHRDCHPERNGSAA